MSTVTIGFVPRERFSIAARALERIFDATQLPFNLIVVDCNIPENYRLQMDKVLEGRDNVRILRTDHYLLPNQSRNLVIREANDEFVCLIENDVLVEDGWLTRLIQACYEHPADVAVPLILERIGEFEKVHFDDRLGHVDNIGSNDHPKLQINPWDHPKENDRHAGRRSVEFIETHCILFRREALSRIGGFDDSITAQEEIDLSLSLRQANTRVVMEPSSVVNFLPPPPVHPDEKEYYFLKWDPETYTQDYKHVSQKWNISDMPSAMGIVKSRRSYASEPDPSVQLRRQLEYRQRIASTADDIAACIPQGETLILVHEEEFDVSDVAPKRRVIPFLERNGQYWGSPENDQIAIQELERMRRDGATLIVFAWPAFWWLEHYAGFKAYLQEYYICSLENERLVAFNL